MNAQRIKILHVADGDARVRGVAHHLVLDLFPAPQVLLDEDLPDRASEQARIVQQLFGRVRDPPARPAQRERGPHDHRQADLLGDRGGLRDGGDRLARQHRDIEPQQELLEKLAILRHADRLERCAQ